MSIVSGTIGAINQRKSAKEAARELSAGREAAMELFDKAQASREEAVRDLEKVGVPTAEAQRIVLESPEFVGIDDLDELLLQSSAYDDIEVDPKALEAQQDALKSLKETAETGITSAERAQQRIMSRSVESQSQARDKSILQNMKERGVGGSGLELATRLKSQQESTNRAADQSLQLQAEARNRALQATQMQGQLGGQIRSQSFGEQAKAANVADQFQKFNIGQKQQFQGQVQKYADQATATGNQQQQLDTQGRQQEFENQMAKQKAVASARSGVAGGLNQAAGSAQASGQAAAQGHLQSGAASSQLMGNIGQANANLGAAYLKYQASDKRAKKNVNDGGDNIKEMMDKINPMEFDYKDENDGEGRRSGVMAQDLEKSDLGAEHIVEDEMGKKYIDTEKMQSTLIAANAQLNNEVNEISEKLDRLEKLLSQKEGLSAPQQSPAPQQFKEGGSYHASNGKGNIVKTGKQMYSGDEVNAKINDHEMILNVAQQDAYSKDIGQGGILNELKKGSGRIDDRLSKGEIEIDQSKQNKLMKHIRSSAKQEHKSELGGLTKREQLKTKLDKFKKRNNRGR